MRKMMGKELLADLQKEDGDSKINGDAINTNSINLSMISTNETRPSIGGDLM